jgi:hypothetical protein
MVSPLASNAKDHHSVLQLASWFLATFRHDNPLANYFQCLGARRQVRPMRNDYSESDTMM